MTTTPEHMTVDVGAEGIDTAALVAEIRAEVSRKRREGVYTDARIARAERHNLMYMADSEELLRFYLNCLRDSVNVDINDFEIEDRRPGFKGKALVKIKAVIWKFLKFYTFRLWHQQNQINALMVTAVESSFQQYEKKIATLEARIAALEGRSQGGDPKGDDSQTDKKESAA
ncbi:MAG: hypothetical protein JJU29_08905 [Verrucomicrobia bacterium]|nr:hypothetical protein [Verrucomicrobiota bacterium]MCH8511389.1 hypothetical protein [Kiritimatiellia bacterium]